jgi:hypothetical protein
MCESYFWDLIGYPNVIIRFFHKKNNFEIIKLDSCNKVISKINFIQQESATITIETTTGNNKIILNHKNECYYLIDDVGESHCLAEILKIKQLFDFSYSLISRWHDIGEKISYPLVDKIIDNWVINDVLTCAHLNIIELRSSMKLDFWNYVKTVLMTMGGY